jgi:hypothetical protein
LDSNWLNSSAKISITNSRRHSYVGCIEPTEGKTNAMPQYHRMSAIVDDESDACSTARPPSERLLKDGVLLARTAERNRLSLDASALFSNKPDASADSLTSRRRSLQLPIRHESNLGTAGSLSKQTLFPQTQAGTHEERRKSMTHAYFPFEPAFARRAPLASLRKRKVDSKSTNLGYQSVSASLYTPLTAQ